MPNAEATGAREALTAIVSSGLQALSAAVVLLNQRVGSDADVLRFAEQASDLSWQALFVAKADALAELAPELERRVANGEATPLTDESFAAADSILAQESHDADSQRCNRATIDDPPAGRGAGHPGASAAPAGAGAVEPATADKKARAVADLQERASEWYAPSTAPAPEEARVWWANLTRGWMHFHESVTRQMSASGDRIMPVVPRAALEDVEQKLDKAIKRALLAEQALDAMREEQNRWKGEYHAAEKHNEILRDTLQEHGDAIRDLRVQLAAATGPVSKETFRRVVDALAATSRPRTFDDLARAALAALNREVKT